jgi:hypothetical protein
MEISFLFVLYLFDRQIQIANTLRCYLPRFVKLSAQIDFRTIPGVGFPQGALLSGNSAPEGDPVTKDERPIHHMVVFYCWTSTYILAGLGLFRKNRIKTSGKRVTKSGRVRSFPSGEIDGGSRSLTSLGVIIEGSSQHFDPFP